MLAMVAFMTLAVSQKAQAIEDPNPKGTIVIGVRGGVLPGFGGNVVADYTLINSWWKGHFTVGAYAGFNSRHHHEDFITYSYRSNFMNFAVMPRATYGLNITDKFEVHAGVMLGVNYQINTWKYDNSFSEDVTHTYVNFAHGELAGVRYMFTDNIGVEAEFIWTTYQNYFNVGLTIKL
jgi:opacity protein-like surface antigen